MLDGPRSKTSVTVPLVVGYPIESASGLAMVGWSTHAPRDVKLLARRHLLLQTRSENGVARGRAADWRCVRIGDRKKKGRKASNRGLHCKNEIVKFERTDASDRLAKTRPKKSTGMGETGGFRRGPREERLVKYYFPLGGQMQGTTKRQG